VSTPPGKLPIDFVFDSTWLDKLASKHHETYVNAAPFPHIVIDNFLPDEVLNNVLMEFPSHEQIDWIKFDTPLEKKLASKVETQIGPYTRFLLYQFNSATFINFLEALTGIHGLIPDPHFWGGGLHQIQPGGLLKIHADFNFHPVLKINRRINLLLYLNKEWDENYGGELQLWDRNMSKCEVKLLPIFNRCVIFNTTDFSFHGHPDPVSCPTGETRKSLALYYYSNGRPVEEISEKHTTLWRLRPGEVLNRNIKATLKKFVPPIVFELRRRVFPKGKV